MTKFPYPKMLSSSELMDALTALITSPVSTKHKPKKLISIVKVANAC